MKNNDATLPQDDHFPVSQEIRHALHYYVNSGRPVGSFLTAVLENNLVEAFARADCHNTENMKNIVGFVYNNIPSTCWGTRERVAAWRERFSS